ncbi:MAG: lysine--tRNA ligase [Spirochaetales bacterium]|nr:lysine--tRNA ligase [Spirochaetales bacterium]
MAQKKKDVKLPEAKPTASDEEAVAETADLYENRLRKWERMCREGRNPYSLSFSRGHLCEELPLTPDGEERTMAGRVKSKRLMGKAGFMDVEDESGRAQIYAREADDPELFALFLDLDLGDIVGFSGTRFTTKTGQPSLRLKSLTLLAKALRPPPVVKESEGKIFDAFADKEQRYRMRYVDLMVNPAVKQVFLMRSRIITGIREFLNARGFVEVETPMMQVIPGGASARPFVTHHNALDLDLYLRIAPELYLKRLLVGGFGRVYEINRNFRNEGISYKHNPEFTMLELYEAYGDWASMMQIFEEMIKSIVEMACGSLQIEYEDNTLDFSRWERLEYLAAIERYAGIKISADSDPEELKAMGLKKGLKKEDLDSCSSIWKMAEFFFDALVEDKLIQPVLITRFPAEISPLAKREKANPDFVERFEPYVAAREIGNAFSELNDPIDQRERFLSQVQERESGKGEGGYMDQDYIRALEYGMPPAGGMGIGIDRLVMLLTNQHSIRDTILFPLMRPEKLEG